MSIEHVERSFHQAERVCCPDEFQMRQRVLLHAIAEYLIDKHMKDEEEMNANMFNGSVGPMGANAPVGQLPSQIEATPQGSLGPTMSDLQMMLQNEQAQHQDAYNYANGHNDHGMGQ